MKRSFNYITEKATKANSKWSNKDLVAFHYFNPNGLYAKKRKNDDRIAELVDAGVIPNGWHVAYGTFASFETNALLDLVNKPRVHSINLATTLSMLERQIETTNEKLSEVS